MKPHSLEQLDAMKNYTESQLDGKERIRFTLNDLTVLYSTVHIPVEHQPFPYAVAAFVVKNEAGETNYEIAVNDDVPEELRGLWAWHELNDFSVVGHGAEDRCLQSEESVLKYGAINSPLYQLYLSYRLPFYSELAVFMQKDIELKGSESQYDISDVKGCYEAIKLLGLKIETNT